MVQNDEQSRRIATVLGDLSEENHDHCMEKFYQHLCASLQLPCEVTGIEDFEWEEIYVVGPGDPAEYRQLRLTKPSCKIGPQGVPPWPFGIQGGKQRLAE